MKITPSRCYVATGGTVRLTGSATDADGDSLTYYWEAPSGSFTAITPNSSQVDWKASSTPGSVTITMTVSDEIAAVTKKQALTICELLPGTIMVTRTIPNAGHHYITRPDVPMRIPGNVEVTIEPGVTIIIDRPAGGIEVNGKLFALGTATQRIRFMGNTCSSETALYTGIYFNDSQAQGILRYCDVTSGMDGVVARNGGAASLFRCQLYNHLHFGASALDGSSIEIVDCTVWDNGDGIFADNSDAEMRRVSVRYNEGDGIVCNQSEDDSPRAISIDSCVVANNVADGIEIGGLVAPGIHYCSIFANNEAGGDFYAIRLSASTVPSIPAENNYWGLGNDTETEIAALILDANDPYTGSTAVVSFSPWLTQAPVARAAPAGGPWAR